MQTPQPANQPFSPQQNAILTSLSQGANRTSACHAAGLPRRTFYNWIKSDAAFSEAVEEAEAESIGVAEDLAYACAMKAIEDPRYLRALFFWLKHRAGWVQARPTPAVGARHAVPSSSPASSLIPTPDPNVPPVDTDDLASVMNLVSEFQRRQREDEEFMRGYEEWKHLSEEEREAILREEESRTPLGESDLPGDGTLAEENPAIDVPFVPSEPSAASAQQSALNLPASNNPKSAIQNPKSVVPSRQRDKLRMQQFRRKHRK